jgi:hypothetical protein
LSHVLLQEGQDLVAAEEALRDVLAIEPQHAEARHNLSLLLQRQNRASDEYVAGGKTLAELYQATCAADSDVQAHLPALFELASHCRHVTALGVGSPAVPTALLFAQPDTLVCYGPTNWPQLQRLQVLAGRTRFHCRVSDAWPVAIAETDLLVVESTTDTARLGEALRRYTDKVRKLVLLVGHDRARERGVAVMRPDAGRLVEELIASSPYQPEQHSEGDGGLIVLAAARSTQAEPAT